MSLLAPISAGAIDAALNSLVHGATGPQGANEDPRTPFVFSSRLRQLLLAKNTDRLAEQGKAQIQTTLLAQNPGVSFGAISAIASQTSQAVAANQAATQPVSDMANSLVRAMPYVSCELNPNSIEFDQPKRYTRQDTQRGTVFYHFTNDKGQNNDLLTIRMQGNTGNLSLRGRTPEDRARSVRRLDVWHNLYQLTREAMLLSDGSPNVFTIDYASALFPVPIRFEGFFTQVLKFSENAKKPNSRDFSMEFVVQATSPDLNTLTLVIMDFVNQQVEFTPNQESKVLGEQG